MAWSVVSITSATSGMASLIERAMPSRRVIADTAHPWQPPPMSPLRSVFGPVFAVRGFAANGAPDAIGERSRFQVRPTPFVGNCDPTRAATAHDAMVVGLADGSVRTLAPTMSGKTWWSAVTPAEGEVLGSDW